jgi:hypothetical protein
VSQSSSDELENNRRHIIHLEEQVTQYQRKISELTTSLVDSRSETDSLQLQLAEQSDMVSDLKVPCNKIFIFNINIYLFLIFIFNMLRHGFLQQLISDLQMHVDELKSQMNSSALQFETLTLNMKHAAEQVSIFFKPVTPQELIVIFSVVFLEGCKSHGQCAGCVSSRVERKPSARNG